MSGFKRFPVEVMSEVARDPPGGHPRPLPTSGIGPSGQAVPVGRVAASSRLAYQVRFFTAAALVNCLEQAQKQYTPERFLKQLDREDLLICDEQGYVSFKRDNPDNKPG
jgi:hypothetical protein